MDVAAFIGLTERGPLDRAVPVGSFDEYRQWFGAAGGGRQLAQAVYLFFANGGRRCVVARCVDPASARATVWRAPPLLVESTSLPIELEARDPGAWGDRLICRLRFVTRPATLAAADGIAWPRAAVTDPSVTKGATLRRAWKEPVVGDAGEIVDRMFEEYGTVEEIERGPRGVRIARIGGLGDPGAALGLVSEVRLEVELGVADQLRERFVDLGLAPDHPRHVHRVLRGDEARGLGQGSRLAVLRGGVDRLVPADRLLLEGRAEWELVPDETDAGGDIVERGADGAATTRRAHFFEAGATNATPFDRLDAYDEANETEPVSLVALPDLVHVRGPEPVTVEEAPDPEALRFGLCAPPTPFRGASAEAEYPLLAATHDLLEARAFQRELVSLCEAVEQRRSAGRTTGWGRAAVLDLPPGLTAGEVVRWRGEVQSERGCAALYAPYLRAAPAEDPTAPLAVVPPCGAACGVIARAEASRGFFVAPANEVVRGVVSLHRDGLLPDAGFLHEARVNLVRATERGLVLLGSRTTSDDVEWTHLSVRRLLHWLERQIAIDTRWAVFEPNERGLWGRLAQGVEQRLDGLLRAGALAGQTARDSYFVRCDAALNARAADQGRVVVEVGVAPSVPAEFIVFELAQLVDGTRLLEERRG
jgi:hypothetical protein